MKVKKYSFQYWLILQAGIVMLSAGVYFFKAPNSFATGGVSGISIILAKLFPVLTQATYMSIINVLLLVIGVVVLGKGVGALTILTSLEYTAMTWIFERVFPMSEPFTDQPLLELVYAMMLTGIGSALIFNCEASSGGTDIVALILKKYSSLDVGKALLVSDSLIVASNFFVSGIKAGLYSVAGLFAKAYLVDGVIESMNTEKAFTIITTKPEEIISYIIDGLHGGATSYEAKGDFTGEKKTVILTVIHRPDATRLRKKIMEVDKHAFVMITNSSEIIGKGFRGV